MPRTTEDYVAFIEDQLGFDPEYVMENIRQGFWSYEYYEFLRNLADMTEDVQDAVDPEVLQELERLRIQLGGGLADRRKYIEEAETELVYVPSSPCCLVKCLEYCEKTLGGLRTFADFHNLLKEHKHINERGEVSLQVLAKVIRYTFCEELLMSPVGIVTWKSKQRRWQLRQGISELVKLRIAYVKFTDAGIIDDMPNRGHYVVFKSRNYIEPAMIPISVKTSTAISLTNQSSYQDFTPRQRSTKIVVWDLEAYRKPDDPDKGKFIEYAIGAMILDLAPLTEDENVVDRITSCSETYKVFHGQSCFMQFMTWLANIQMPGVQCWAHNSGMFDTLLLRQTALPMIQFTEKIENNCKRIISQRVKFLGQTFTFKDSCAFLAFSLRALCKPFFFNNHFVKSKMEHSTITLENYEARMPEWEPYLKLDVQSLAEILYKFEMNLWGIFGESITCALTISSVANSIMRKTCYLKEVYKIDDMLAQATIQLASYGGRIFHTVTRPNRDRQFDAVMTLYEQYYPEILNGWHKLGQDPDGRPCYQTVRSFIRENFDKVICLDANQLYPAAMTEGSFPIGRAMMHPDLPTLQAELIEGTFTGRAICDVTMEAPPCFLPITPVKTEKYGNYFPVGVFRQCMTDVDIQESIRFGYTLVEIHLAIYWPRHSRLFADIMPFLFNKRNEARAAKNAAMVQTLKLAANSMFGVNLKRPIETEYGYKLKPKAIKRTKRLNNGQMEYEYRTTPKLVCAPQIGAYVLAYSRVIMNRLVEKLHANWIPDIILYGDTDSVYISMALLPIAGFSTALGGFKNDYDEGKHIVNYRFLGAKRYSLRFNDPPRSPEQMDQIEAIKSRIGPMTRKEVKLVQPDVFKHKMCGVRFLNERKRNVTDTLPLGGHSVEQLPSDREFFEQLDEYLQGSRHTIRWFQDVWRRTDRGVFIFDRQLKELSKAAPRRNFLANGSSTPLLSERSKRSKQSKRQIGRDALLVFEMRRIEILPTRDYAATTFRYDPYRMGLRFPPNSEQFMAGSPKAVVTSNPKLATSFVTSGVKLSKKVELVDCSEIKMVFKKHFKDKETDTVFEYYDVCDMTFAGPKHKEDGEPLDREQLLQQYAYVLLSNMPFLANELQEGRVETKRFLDNIITAIRNPQAAYKIAEPLKETSPLPPSKTRIRKSKN